MNNTRAEVYNAIDGERDYQTKMFGEADEQGHSVPAWITFMKVYVDKAAVSATEGEKYRALSDIRKIAALAVSCMEVHGASYRSI